MIKQIISHFAKIRYNDWYNPTNLRKHVFIRNINDNLKAYFMMHLSLVSSNQRQHTKDKVLIEFKPVHMLAALMSFGFVKKKH